MNSRPSACWSLLGFWWVHSRIVRASIGARLSYTEGPACTSARASAVDGRGQAVNPAVERRLLSRTFSLASVSNVKYINTQLGHASVQITCDRYGHLFPDEHRVAARRLENAR